MNTEKLNSIWTGSLESALASVPEIEAEVRLLTRQLREGVAAETADYRMLNESFAKETIESLISLLKELKEEIV